MTVQQTEQAAEIQSLLQREVSPHVEQLNEGDDPDALIADALLCSSYSLLIS